MRVTTLVLALLLTGCAASPPARFYTLDPVAPLSNPPATAALTVQVAAVRIPGILDRQEMVRESAPETLELSDRNRWGAPLGQMMQRVLTQDLAARLPGSTLLGPTALPPAGSRIVAVDVLRFDAGPSGEIVLQGSWTLLAAGNDRPLASHSVNLASAGPIGDYAEQAAAMSRLLGRLADRIAAALTH